MRRYGHRLRAAAGDSADWRDSRKPRLLSRYSIRGGVSNLFSRAWNVFSRGTHDGWPFRTRAAIRAATSSAIFAEPANARSLSVAVIDDDADVPVLMRSRPLNEEQADGTLRTWSYLYGDTDSDGTNDVLEITTRSGTTTHPNGLAHISTYTVERLDAVFGRLLYRETRLYTGGGSDPVLDWEERQYDDKGRHIRSDFSDGTSEEKAWGCCRLEASWSRDGSLRDYLAIPGEDHWSAVAERALGALPGANGRHPVNESFTDALGRETNAVRAVWQSTSRDAAYAPLQTRTEYPLGTDHYRVVTDPLGVQTVSRNQAVNDDAGTLSETRVTYDRFGNIVTNAVTYGDLTVMASTAYDSQGRATAQTDALGNATHTAYDSLGNVMSVWGATYPVSYTYNTAGRMVALATTRDGAAWDTTQWFYDPATGLATNKVYADNTVISYTYDAASRPVRTTWARGAWREYAYNAIGLMASTAYSDGTPAVALAYDAFQRLRPPVPPRLEPDSGNNPRSVLHNHQPLRLGQGFEWNNAGRGRGRRVARDPHR